MGIKYTGTFKGFSFKQREKPIIISFIEQDLKYTVENWWKIKGASLQKTDFKFNNGGGVVPSFSSVILPTSGVVLVNETYQGSGIVPNFTSNTIEPSSSFANATFSFVGNNIENFTTQIQGV